MKAVMIEKPWSVSCAERDVPSPGKGEALVRIVSAGICGSDIGAYRGTNGLVSYPRVIGHEAAGIVEAVDPEDNPKGIKPGDEVILDPYIYCGSCYPCSIGRTNCCTGLRVLGVHTDGAMAGYFCHPSGLLVKKPKELDWTRAAMIEPLTISLHGVHRGRLAEGEYCAIYGAGPIGLLAGLVAKAYGARPILIDIVQERLEFAARLGIERVVNSAKEDVQAAVCEITGGAMAQLVMECTGANACIRGALDIASHAGRITFTGWPKKESSLPTDLFTRKELDLLGARNSACEFEEAVELAVSGRVDLAGILTETVAIEDAPQAIRDIEREPGRYMKVVVKF